jgi:hypothetical protein
MAWQTIDGETVLLNIDGKELLGVNEAAARMWALCDGARTLDEIAALIAAEFDVSAADAAADVRAFASELAAAGALNFRRG